jgi:hypothetical protein
MIREFTASVSFPVRLYENETRLGVVKNFDRVLGECSGDIIFLADQDDIWLPHKIERIAGRFAEKPELGMVFTNAKLIDEHQTDLGVTLWSRRFERDAQIAARRNGMIEAILNRDIVTGATMAFRSKFLDTIRPIPTNIPDLIHDKWIAFVIAAQADVEFLTDCLTLYRQHPGQQIGATVSNQDTGNTQPAASQIAILKAGIEYNEKRYALMKEIQAELARNPVSISAKFLETAGRVTQAQADEAKQAIEHFSLRSSLSGLGWRRSVLVAREYFSGRYDHFSRGLRSALKDIFGL